MTNVSAESMKLDTILDIQFSYLTHLELFFLSKAFCTSAVLTNKGHHLYKWAMTIQDLSNFIHAVSILGENHHSCRFIS